MASAITAATNRGNQSSIGNFEGIAAHRQYQNNEYSDQGTTSTETTVDNGLKQENRERM